MVELSSNQNNRIFPNWAAYLQSMTRLTHPPLPLLHQDLGHPLAFLDLLLQAIDALCQEYLLGFPAVDSVNSQAEIITRLQALPCRTSNANFCTHHHAVHSKP